MIMQEIYIILVQLVSVIGFIWGIILNARHRNLYALRKASNMDKWKWALTGSISLVLPIAGFILAQAIRSEGLRNILSGLNIIFVMFGFVFLAVVIWSRWDLERMNKRNIRYSRKERDSERLRLNQDIDFLSPGVLAKFNQDGFPEDGIPLLITQTLTQDEMEDQIGMIYKFLKRNRLHELIFTFGFGAGEEMYIPKTINLNDLIHNIEESISQGKFRLGYDDLFIKDINKTLEFTLCHESGVYFSSKDNNLLEEVESIWMGMGLQVRLVYEKSD